MSVVKSDIGNVEGKAERLINRAADSIEDGVVTAKRKTNRAAQAAGSKFKTSRTTAKALLQEGATTSYDALDVTGHRLQQYRDQAIARAEEALKRTATYAQAKPLQSILIAAVTGALFAGLFGKRR